MSDRAEKTRLRLTLKGFLEGDSLQFRAIKNKITQYVYHQRFGDDMDRDELISDIIIILLENLNAGKFKGDSLSALNVYIYSIIRHRIYRVLRRRCRFTYEDSGTRQAKDGHPPPDEQVAAKATVDKILRALDSPCRILLRLKFQEGWSDQEIADHVKKTRNATSTAISRCLKKVRALEIVRELK